jgi:outer membrane protein OmpA-like peptidoglycan-associated protein
MTRDDITHGMQVLGSDGGLIGSVDGVESEGIKLQRAAAGDGLHHYVPADFIDHVDQHVHLNVTAATARDRWVAGSGAAAGVGAAGATTAAHRDDDRDRKGMGWLPWVIGALVLLGLILALRGCDDDDDRVAPDPAATTAEGLAITSTATLDENGANLKREVETYLAGAEPTPRTFGFNNVFFDTGSSTIRPDDQKELASLAAVLAKRPTLKADVVGLADAQGDSADNAKLAKARADAVVTELVKNGVPAAALTARGAGEGNSAGADQGSRRADLVINAR